MPDPRITAAAQAAAPKVPHKSPTGCRPAQLFGLWSIEPERFKKLYSQAMRVDLVALGESLAKRKRADTPDAPLPSQRPDVGDSNDEYDLDDEDDSSDMYQVNSGIAQISISGPMSKYETSFQAMFGGTSTLKARRALRMADDDPDVDAIMLAIDSPGGTVDGTSDLGDTIAKLSKPCYAFISDNGCSAAYWAASQADRVYCNRTAEVGCIGVVMRLEDTSKMYEQAGVKVHIVSSGGMKGAGMDGAPVTDEQIAYFEQIAEDVNDQFISAIAAGRNMSTQQARALADGRVHVGAKAQQLGLVDEVASYDDAMKALYLEALNMSNPTEAFKASHPEAYKALESQLKQAGKDDGLIEGRKDEIERMKALSAAFADRPAFAVEQFVSGHDVAKAKAELADVLIRENAALRQQQAQATQEQQRRQQLAEAAHPQTPGCAGVGMPTATAASGRNAKVEFNRRVDELAKTMKRTDAVNKVASEDPALYQEMLDAANADRK